MTGSLRGVMVAALGGGALAAALFGAGIASADGLTTQSGGSVDYDGTQGDWNGSVTGSQRQLTTQATEGHAIVSDACAVLGGSYPNYGCPPPSSFDPRTISATSGTSDDPDSALDPDGYQADQISTSPKYVPPHH